MEQFERLHELENQENNTTPSFEGVVQKIKITSNCLGYGPGPKPDDEVEQHLTITAEGNVFISSYCWSNCGRYRKKWARSPRIDVNVVAHILERIGDYFSSGYEINLVTDIGSWEIELTNVDGKRFCYSGSLCSDGDDLEDISSTLRASLDMPDLFVFDGNSCDDRIEKLTIDYHRITKIKPPIQLNLENEYLTWNYTERILIERASETLEQIQNIGPKCTVSRKYHIEDGIATLLDEYYSNDLLSKIKGNPPDAIDDPLETRDYTITIDLLYSGRRVISGSFDKNGLPEDFPDFAEEVLNLMCFYGMGEIFDPAFYGKAKRTRDGYIFCSVTFEEGGKSYFYLTDDESLQIGDLVLVPVGSSGRTATVEIVDIEYCSEEDAPFPLDKVKRIIRKYTNDDAEPL